MGRARARASARARARARARVRARARARNGAKVSSALCPAPPCASSPASGNSYRAAMRRT